MLICALAVMPVKATQKISSKAARHEAVQKKGAYSIEIELKGTKKNWNTFKNMYFLRNKLISLTSIKNFK